MTYRCPVCGVEHEDEGLCVACWDLRCAGATTTLRGRRNIGRNREIVTAYAAGESGVAIARRLGLGLRTVFWVLEKAK